MMAQTVNINFSIDSDLIKGMEEACDELGMSVTTAFTIFAKKVAAGQVHFTEHELIEVDD